MKRLFVKLPTLLVAILLSITMVPTALAAEYTYPINGGGELIFDPTTGTILDVKHNNKIISVDIPQEIMGITVTSIDEYAFNQCYNLLNITIPETVTSIGAYAFAECKSLTKIVIPNSVTYIGENLFYRCSELKSATISGNIEVIPKRTFYYCGNLESVILLDGIKTISNQAFLHCDNLKELSFPNSVQTLELNAISMCDSLNKITFGSGIKTIARGALQNANEVYFNSNAPIMDSAAFLHDASPIIYYPANASGWSTV